MAPRGLAPEPLVVALRPGDGNDVRRYTVHLHRLALLHLVKREQERGALAVRGIARFQPCQQLVDQVEADGIGIVGALEAQDHDANVVSGALIHFRKELH